MLELQMATRYSIRCNHSRLCSGNVGSSISPTSLRTTRSVRKTCETRSWFWQAKRGVNESWQTSCLHALLFDCCIFAQELDRNEKGSWLKLWKHGFHIVVHAKP